MLKYLLILAFLIFPVSKLTAQQTDSSSKSEFGIKFGGFVRADFYWDTRENEGLRENTIVLYPKNVSYDADGNDINAKSSFGWNCIATRVNAKISSPDFLQAKTTGFIEAEFFGQADAQTNVLRLRHAYIDLDWKTSKLLIGQTWNPMFEPEASAQSLALSAGAPVTALVRNPQIKYQYRCNSDLYLSATAMVQRDFTSVGPNGASTEYVRYSMLPTFNLQLKYKNSNGITTGISSELKTLRPYKEFTDITNKSHNVETNLTTFAVNAFFGLNKQDFNLRINGWYGGNMADLLMQGGYAVAEYDKGIPSAYTPFNNIAGMIDFAYSLTKNAKVGIYAGANKNLGTSESFNVNNPYWARVKDIDMLMRVSPRFTYQVSKVQLGAELEYTAANYGAERSLSEQNQWEGKWESTTNVNNIRFLLAATLFF